MHAVCVRRAAVFRTGSNLPRIVTFQPTELVLGQEVADGRIAFADGQLLGVLACLRGRHYGEHENHWNLEVGFGECAEKHPLPFATLEQAADWISGQCAAPARSAVRYRATCGLLAFTMAIDGPGLADLCSHLA